jgi:peptide/nickel transport system permease protein
MSTTTRSMSRIISLESESTRQSRSLTLMAIRRFFKHRMAVFGALLLLVILLFVIVGAQFYTEHSGNRTNVLDKETPPNSEYPFGTDQVGRNVLPRMIYGGQISLAIGAVSVTIAIIVGTAVGLLGGYFGGWVDAILSRFTEALLSIPVLILLLVLSSVLSRESSTVVILGREVSATVVVIVGIIGLTSWMQLSRIVRSLVLSFKEQDFILAARALGARDRRIILRHILPNCMAPIIVSATLGIGTAIIIEAYLSFLGFGVQPPTATWGNILNAAQNNVETRWWLWMIPGTFIVCTVLAINFIGDGLRDALDPRSIQ